MDMKSGRKKMLIVGVTGGIASGKSTLLGIFRSLGVAGIDSDGIVHQLLKRGTRVFSEVVAAFGEKYLNRFGELDRRHLGRTVFSSRAARLRLERIVHPAVFAEIARQTQAMRRRGRRMVAIDIPLLYETRATGAADLVAVAYVPRPVQMRRLMKRSLTRAESAARIRAQWGLDWKRRRADVVFDMTKSLRRIKREVRSWLSKVA